MDVLKDRYFLICIAAVFILVASSFFWNNDGEEEGTSGIARDVKETENGFVFSLEDSSGEEMRCFSKERPEPGAVYRAEGSLSEDGTMLFISSLELLLPVRE